jgi:hypothetical protein
MKKERRRIKRIHPTEKVPLLFSCNSLVIGRIHSISPQGVSVEYEEGSCRPELGHDILIKIADAHQQPDCADEIRCITVYDIPTLSQGQTFRGKKMRLMGMHYAETDLKNRDKIDRLLASVPAY